MTPRLRSLILLTTAVGVLVGCDGASAEGVLQPDTQTRPLPQPIKSALVAGPSLLEAEPLERALGALTTALRRGDAEIEVLELRATADSLLLQVADPTAPGRVQQWEYSGGKVK